METQVNKSKWHTDEGLKQGRIRYCIRTYGVSKELAQSVPLETLKLIGKAKKALENLIDAGLDPEMVYEMCRSEKKQADGKNDQ